MNTKYVTMTFVAGVLGLISIPATVQAQDLTLKDAIQCKDFKRAADGNWHAEDVSVTYGPKNKQQLNLFNSTTIRKGTPIGGIDLWTTLNDKCGTGQ